MIWGEQKLDLRGMRDEKNLLGGRGKKVILGGGRGQNQFRGAGGIQAKIVWTATPLLAFIYLYCKRQNIVGLSLKH